MSDRVEGGGIEAGGPTPWRARPRARTVPGSGVGGLDVEVVDRNVGQDVLLARVTTGEHWRYEARFTGLDGKAQPDLQAQVRADETADVPVLAASDVRYNATDHETLDILPPANSPGLPSEYETLNIPLEGYPQRKLGVLKEGDGRHDVTYLAKQRSRLNELADSSGDNGSGDTASFVYATVPSATNCGVLLGCAS